MLMLSGRCPSSIIIPVNRLGIQFMTSSHFADAQPNSKYLFIHVAYHRITCICCPINHRKWGSTNQCPKQRGCYPITCIFGNCFNRSACNFAFIQRNQYPGQQYRIAFCLASVRSPAINGLIDLSVTLPSSFFGQSLWK